MVERSANISKSIEQYRTDTFYFDNNREQLAKDHPSSYVGILNEKVVGEAKTMQELVDNLVDAGINPGYVFVGHTAPAERVVLILSNS